MYKIYKKEKWAKSIYAVHSVHPAHTFCSRSIICLQTFLHILHTMYLNIVYACKNLHYITAADDIAHLSSSGYKPSAHT